MTGKRLTARNHRWIAAIALLSAAPGLASDACSGVSIHTRADVQVSDGTSFATESLYQGPGNTVIRHVADQIRTTAVEGPFGWVATGADASLGGDFHKHFALGHQVHAMWLHFDDIAEGFSESDAIPFAGEMQSGLSGGFPYGGQLHLVAGTSEERPRGLVLTTPDGIAIEMSFEDWRRSDSTELPYLVRIDDGERVFDYRYSSIDTQVKDPRWMYDAVPDPDIDVVRIYRVHRRQLAAHCAGDAAAIAGSSLDSTIVASRGELFRSGREEMQNRFEALFERVDYREYHDLVDPVVSVAASGDIGWIAVNVRAVGVVRATGEAFDDRWAWVMMMQKVDDRWLHAGNASNRR